MKATPSPMPPPAGRHDIVISMRVPALGRRPEAAVPLCSNQRPSTVVHAITRGRSRRVTTAFELDGRAGGTGDHPVPAVLTDRAHLGHHRHEAREVLEARPRVEDALGRRL